MARQPAPAVCERFHQAIELIGARWTGAIIQVLLNGPVRYADLRAAVPEISDRMLCERLRALEDAAIVQRRVSTDPPVRVDYDLTDKGKALGPALNAIGRWAEQWAVSGEARPAEARRPAKVSASPRARRTAGV